MATKLEFSKYFIYEETVFSQTASRNNIDNTPSEKVRLTIDRVAYKMDQVRELLNTPVIISSWYRCKELNKLIGSIASSQHIKGEAIDFTAPKFGSPLDICRKLVSNVNSIRYDQLILEHDWVHISFCLDRLPRRQVLTLLSNNKYAVGITNKKGEPI